MIYITAIVKTKSAYLDEVKLVLENMVIQTRKEEACLQYDLHQGIEDKNQFVFYEIWEDEEGLNIHNKQAHIQEFISLPSAYFQEKPLVILTQKIEK
ncbi:MAG: putative quinol monooxygenase [Algoriella sp.]|uniref:putative quinol monooxygenase n=1 Tax=Algoriella sp. TaxID=1872434 RepID=UPI002FC8D6AE